MTSCIFSGLVEQGGGSVRRAGCTSREPLGRFCSFFCRPINMAEYSRFTKIHNPRLDILDFRRFLHYHGNAFGFTQHFISRRRSPAPRVSTHQISAPSVEKRLQGGRTRSQRLLLLLYDFNFGRPLFFLLFFFWGGHLFPIYYISMGCFSHISCTVFPPKPCFSSCQGPASSTHFTREAPCPEPGTSIVYHFYGRLYGVRFN